jgi:23S rRNA pseudouridine2605 synthase
LVANAPVGREALDALRRGVMLDDGQTAPAEVRRITADTLELTIHEGRKRQVRRMCESVGHPVRSLARTAIGPLALGDLRSGAHRRLTDGEVAALNAAGAEGRRAEATST